MKSQELQPSQSQGPGDTPVRMERPPEPKMQLHRPFGLATLLLSIPVQAGPPFLTDDPVPTDTGHWEIYAPLLEAEGKRNDYEGAFGAELNYGAAANLQLTVGLPAAYTHGADGMHWGAGDLKVSTKYRFYHDESTGFQIAAFPGITLPTATNDMGGNGQLRSCLSGRKRTLAPGRSSAVGVMQSNLATAIATIGPAE